MHYSQMDITEVARFLGMDLRRLQKMAQRGGIPCQKVAGQFRFHRVALTDWMQQRIGTLPHDHLADMEAGITAHREVSPDEMIITPMLQHAAISTHLQARTKHSVLRELVNLAKATELLWDSAALLEALNAREELCSTAMEAGIAIPHPHRPLPYAVAEPILVIARTSQGIGFGAANGRLTNLFFMTCSQDGQHHLHILARLCRMLHDGNFIEDIRHAETPEEMIELCTTREASVIEKNAQ